MHFDKFSTQDFNGLFKLGKSKHKLNEGIAIVLVCTSALLGTICCFNEPTKSKLLESYDTTNQSMFIYEDSIGFSGKKETIPYSYRDIVFHYTVCTPDDSGKVDVYEEKFGNLKEFLAFKPSQNIYEIQYYDKQIV